MRRITWSFALLGALALTTTACQGDKKPAAPAKTAKAATSKPAKKAEPKPAEAKPAAAGDAAAAEAKTVYTTRCATCHGAGGMGDGPASAALNPKPRTLTDAAWQDKVTDEHIAKVIVEGGGAVGLSVMMAANPDLKAKPEVVKGLVKIVRSFKK